MRTSSKPIVYSFFLSFILTLSLPVLWPSLHLAYFSPFFAVAYYRRSFLWCLLLSLIAGALLDLFSSTGPLGMHALNFCLTTALIYHKKRFFYQDALTTIPIITTLISAVSTLLHLSLLSFFGEQLPITKTLLLTDIVIMPLVDGVYAFLLFTLPLAVLKLITIKKPAPALKRPH
ncbi:mreD [Simkania negevensis]|uniref:MreD n=1 Tax=Simkania negevensis TaxID=83561 RepID=A0ABS3AQS4_9BACT|nr:mreD [Simkania negevensis]